MQPKPEVVVDMRCDTGEGPLWHPDEGRLYWVDIPAGHLFAFDPESGRTQTWELGVAIGGFTLHEDGRLLLFMADGAIKLWSPGGLERVIDSLPEEIGNRFNDVIADPEGRVYCGVMSTEQRAGRLYRLDPDGHISIMLENTGTSNGMGFSPDLKQLYYCDSRHATLSVFDYDRTTGALTNRKILLTTSGEDGRPDGMTVDVDGLIWSARWDGGRLVHLSPKAETLNTILFPAQRVSCVTFGGKDYTDMYVTTAGGQDRASYGKKAGSLFRIRGLAKGVPEFRSRLD